MIVTDLDSTVISVYFSNLVDNNYIMNIISADAKCHKSAEWRARKCV